VLRAFNEQLKSLEALKKNVKFNIIWYHVWCHDLNHLKLEFETKRLFCSDRLFVARQSKMSKLYAFKEQHSLLLNSRCLNNFLLINMHGKNGTFAKVSKNLADIDLKIILLDHQIT